ncbi:MAG TPA: type VI secretion system tip protein TssI/VgrG [Gemmatimonadaceae bacterium]|nr:type VI secretion system tip protein TssI/VgrG [Gemmatimonadaceae bacterium]
MTLQTEVTATLTYEQKGRAISVETVLGPDALLLESFEGKESIAGGFKYTLGLLGKDPGISATKLIRTLATVKLAQADGSERVINGLISRFVQLDQAEGLTVYEAEIRPWYWFLSLTSDFCVWQNKSIPEIVKAVCNEQGFTDLVFKCVKTHKPHEYRVQYGETHLDFITRLMEEEGIFWFAEHDGKKCNMIVADDNSVAKTAVKLRLSTIAHDTEDEAVLGWFNVSQDVRPGKYTHMDYNFETPSTQLKGQHAGKHASEVVEFPGGFTTRDDADPLATLRYQEIVAEQIEAEGAGRCRALKAGGKIEVSKHPNRALNTAYLITSVKQSAKLGDFRTGGDPGLAFKSSFTAIPFDTPYKPERSTELPRAYGYESAMVVGPAGEEIFTDKYGRVKVQFFWDRRGKKDDKSSCWVRVSTVWAGKGWGVINTPRIGQEVLVAFLNGDPEDPIIVGRVYNAEQMPPYALPANKTQSGIKTRSTLGGTPDNFNEIRFEDKKGSEQLYIHAEKDKQIVVEHDRAISVGNNDAESVGNDQTIEVGNNQQISVAKDRTDSVGKNESISIGSSRTENVGKDDSITVSGNRTLSVGKDESLTVGGNRNESVSKNVESSVGDDRKSSIGKDETISIGKHYALEAGDEIVLKTGSASITMKKDGTITIKGNNISIEGSGKINVKASSDVAIKGSQIKQN